jgi:hypothetical protein
MARRSVSNAALGFRGTDATRQGDETCAEDDRHGTRTEKIPKRVRPAATAPKGKYRRGSHGYVSCI